MARAQSIFIIRPGTLGDTFLTFPLLASVRRRHPDARITLFGNRACKDLVPAGIEFQAVDSAESVWLFVPDRAEFPGQRVGCDLAYVIANNPERLARNLQRAGAGELRAVGSVPPEGKHLVEHIHEGLGFPVPSRSPCLAHLVPEKKKDLIWIHPGSGSRRKCPPVSFMAAVTEIVTRHTGWPAAITVGEDDAFLKEQPAWEELIGKKGTVVFDNRPLPELCKELSAAGLFIGNDSGIAHLAAGLGIPSVVFFFSTDPAQWAPWVPLEQFSVIDLRPRPSEGNHCSGKKEE